MAGKQYPIRSLSWLTLAVFALSVFGLTGIAGAQAMFRADPAHSGIYSGSAPRQFHRVKWKFATGDRVVSSPVFANNVIYFGGDDNNIYAVKADTGAQLWKYETGGPVPATPAIVDGTLYVGSYDGKFYALDANTGTTKWKFATEGERRFEAKGLHGLQPRSQTIVDTFDVYLSSPVVAQNTVYFGSGDGNLYAVDTASGDLKWRFKTGDIVHASPAYADGLIYFGSWDSYFYAIDATTGKEKWRFHGGEDALVHNQVGFQSSPMIANGVVYTGCRDSNVYALDARTGKEKWRFNNEMSWVNASPALTDGKLLFATSDSSLYHAVDVVTGKSIYKQDAKAYMFSSPAVAGDVVLIGVLNGTLMARDLKTGNPLWEYQVERSKQNSGWVLTSERRFNGPLLYFSNWREAPTIASERQVAVGAIFSSPLVVNGVVYFGSADGYLYALD